MAENDQLYKKLWWENRKISREENWPRGQGTDLRRQKKKERKDQKGMWPATGENSHLRHLKYPWAEAPDLWTTHTDKSVREGTLHWLDYVLGPEGKNCLNIFFFFFFAAGEGSGQDMCAFTQLRGSFAHFPYTSSSQSPSDAWILRAEKTTQQISHVGLITGWPVKSSFDLIPSHQDKEHSVHLILSLQTHLSAVSW